MSKKKIDNLVKQLSESELEILAGYIERQYAVEFKGEVVRDDIRDRVIELLLREFVYLEPNFDEDSLLEKDLVLDAVEITGFAETLVEEFELEGIEFAEVMRWTMVKDIVNYIENALECAVEEE